MQVQINVKRMATASRGMLRNIKNIFYTPCYSLQPTRRLSCVDVAFSSNYSSSVWARQLHYHSPSFQATPTTSTPEIAHPTFVPSANKLKKPQRKRRTSIIEDEQQNNAGTPQWEVYAYSTAEEYDLEKLMLGLQTQGLYHASSMSEGSSSYQKFFSQVICDIHDVLHVSARYQVDREPREIYFFREGSVVFWNVSEVERKNVLMFLKPYEEDSYDKEIVAEGNERMVYTYTEVFNKTRLMNGRILLNAEGSTDLEKYTFSNALALSVKLATWEASLEKYVDSIEFVVDDLKEGGRIKLSRADVLKKQGELFSLRHLINLSSDLLDTPDFYWDRENLENLYHKTCNHLNITKRTRVMNEKLNHCCELVELLSRQLTDAHHTRLEWMIIALITVEVAFEVAHMFR